MCVKKVLNFKNNNDDLPKKYKPKIIKLAPNCGEMSWFYISPSQVNKFINNKTILYKYVKLCNLNKIKCLIEKLHANPNIGTSEGKTPLYKAVFETGMNINFYYIAEYFIKLKVKDSFYKTFTALHLAAFNCDIKLIKLFADNHYNFTIKTMDSENTLNIVELILLSDKSEFLIFKALNIIPKNQIKLLISDTLNKIKNYEFNVQDLFDKFCLKIENHNDHKFAEFNISKFINLDDSEKIDQQDLIGDH